MIMAGAKSLACLLLLASFCFALRKPQFPSVITKTQQKGVSSEESSLSFTVNWFDQDIDHFDFTPTNPPTYKQRYILSDQYWGTTVENAKSNPDQECPGPIFFYTGNEGDIFMFFNNTGFVTDALAPQFNALVIFAEHRYYGESMPFGNSSFDLDKVGYLTVEQALADYAVLITQIKEDLNAQDCPVISFGGSYGGMLTAWFRLKYPNIVDGGLAASAPILQFNRTGVSQWIYNEIVTNDFADAVPQCADWMRIAFNNITNMGNSQAGIQALNKIFLPCQPLQNANDVNNLVQWIEGGLGYMAMIDYPYPNSFLEPVPASPVNVSCQKMQESLQSGADYVVALNVAAQVYYNYTGSVQCNDLNLQATGDLGTQAWDYQSCTEIVMPMSTNGTSDMFPPSYFSYDQWAQYCQSTWGVTPRPNWITTYFGGDLLPSGLPNIQGSNIIFSNGNLDPWSGGGVLQTLSQADDLIALYIEGGAHHLDLRAPNPADGPGVIEARKIETQYIQQWISDKYEKLKQQKMSQ